MVVDIGSVSRTSKSIIESIKFTLIMSLSHFRLSLKILIKEHL